MTPEQAPAPTPEATTQRRCARARPGITGRSASHLTRIDEEGATGHEQGEVAGAEEDHSSHIIGAAGAPQQAGVGPFEIPLAPSRRGLYAGGDHDARRDGEHPNPIFGELQCESAA